MYKIVFGVFDRPRGLHLDSEEPQRKFTPVFVFMGNAVEMEQSIRFFADMFSIDPFDSMVSTDEKTLTYLLGKRNGYRIYKVD